jgi:hypothetical protein
MSRPLDDREQEDLVAFLDGELTGEEALLIERKLSLDPTARAEADRLKRTWDLLDFLPRPEPSASFTQKTLTRLSAVRGDSLLPPSMWRDRRWMSFGAIWVAMMAVAMLSGFQGYRHLAAASGKSLPQEKRTETEEESIARLPRKLQDEINNLPSDQRAEGLRKLRDKEGELRKLWMSASGLLKAKPERLGEFPVEVQTFVRDYLEKRLNEYEKQQLKAAEGSWPNYARMIYDLYERHPQLPYLAKTGPVTSVDQLKTILSPEIKTALFRGFRMGQLEKLQGKWPEFALQVVSFVEGGDKNLSSPLGASKLDEFPADMRSFIDNNLMRVLKEKEKDLESLKNLEGRWPGYPIRVRTLAERYDIVIPGLSIPGPPALWKSAKLALRGG